MAKNKLLTEIERQQKYLGELDAQFTLPLFSSKKALESQRKAATETPLPLLARS